MFFFFLPKSKVTLSAALTLKYFTFYFAVRCVICVFACVFLVSQGLADLGAPPLKQKGTLGSKRHSSTLYSRSVLTCLLELTHKLLCPPWPSAVEAETRLSSELRFIFNIYVYIYIFSTSVAAQPDLHQVARISTPEHFPPFPPNVPLPFLRLCASSSVAPPALLLCRLFDFLPILLLLPHLLLLFLRCLGLLGRLAHAGELVRVFGGRRLLVVWRRERGRGGGKGVRRRRCSGCGDTTPYFIRAEPDECVYLLIVLYRRKVWLLRTKVAESQYAFLPQLFVIFSISLPLKVRDALVLGT